MASKQKSLQFIYRNHRGEVAKRYVEPIRMYYGNTEYHPENQWFLEAVDIERKVVRDFAVKDILCFL